MVARTVEMLDNSKVQAAISSILRVFADEELTVAEAIKAVRAVDSSLRSVHGPAYEIMDRVCAES